ncbi:hypothetical protein FRC12_005783 [Ceratobasidium sp. 428]|nr:hypothetical protein FRC12_005783 [Ceratobasidium sp. 428]
MRTGEKKYGGVNSRKEAPTVDKLGVQGESKEEEMPDTCPCIGSFILPIPLNGGDKLMVRTTHPRVMFELAFLVSSVSRQDVVGRKPRRIVFAVEGLRASEEIGVHVAFPVCATLQDMKRTGLQLAEIRVDLLRELVATPRTRPELDRLAELVVHARNFSRLDSRYFMHTSLTLEDARTEPFHVMSTSGYNQVIPAWLLHPYLRPRQPARPPTRHIRTKKITHPIQCFSNVLPTYRPRNNHRLHPLPLPLRPRPPHTRLSSYRPSERTAQATLGSATRAQDNYTRALAPAMSACHYMHTAKTHAGTMFGIVERLVVGMDAVEKGKEGENGKKGNGSMGNALLGRGLG